VNVFEKLRPESVSSAKSEDGGDRRREFATSFKIIHMFLKEGERLEHRLYRTKSGAKSHCPVRSTLRAAEMKFRRRIQEATLGAPERSRRPLIGALYLSRESSAVKGGKIKSV